MDVKQMAALSRKAQKQFETFSQQQVDEIVRAIGRVVYDNAEPYAKMAAEETRMGVYQDKINKNLGKSRIIYNSLKGVASVGVIRDDKENMIVEVAKPMGVVAAITPCTNPIVTPMCNAMFALKARNSIIIAPHPRAKRCAVTIVDAFNKAIAALGAPENLIMVIPEPSNEITAELMKVCDVTVATGGMGMVKAAYSSGRPAYGVGPGNVQCILDKGIDVAAAVKKAIDGRVFDNGIICSGEQTLIVHKDDYQTAIQAAKEAGAYYTDKPEEVEKIRQTVFPGGIMNRDLVGQSALAVAEKAGIAVPEGTRVIIAKAEGIGEEDLLCEEKMCPVMASFAYDTFEEAIEIANANLDVVGKGHSISLHSQNAENIEYAASHVPVCRVLVNQICSTMNGGSFYNGLTPTTTLGCGSWGNNSISENFGLKHMMNITRIAYHNKDAKVPTDEEIWG
ncbi:MAG: aldehyde dehydrogenase family protein [Oscillospiraceae bacterium]